MHTRSIHNIGSLVNFMFKLCDATVWYLVNNLACDSPPVSLYHRKINIQFKMHCLQLGIKTDNLWVSLIYTLLCFSWDSSIIIVYFGLFLENSGLYKLWINFLVICSSNLRIVIQTLFSILSFCQRIVIKRVTANASIIMTFKFV